MSFKEFKEHNVRAGLGTALCYMKSNESSYHVLCAVESLPAVFGSQDTIDYSTTTNRSVTQVPGKRTTEPIEVELAYNIDNIMIMDDIKDEKIKFAYIDLDDFSGHEFEGIASYRMADVGTSDIKKLVLNIAVTSAKDTITYDLYDFFMDTVQFDDNIPTAIVLSQDDSSTEIKVGLEPSTATIEVKSSAEQTIKVTKDTTTPTKIKIEAENLGSAIVTITATASGYAPNKRTVKVISSN